MTDPRENSARELAALSPDVKLGSSIKAPKGQPCSRCFRIIREDGHSGYCSSDCFLAENDEQSQSKIRSLVLARDHGQCALCPNKTLALRAFADTELVAGVRRRRNCIAFMKKLGFTEKDVVDGRALWDFDHVNPRAAKGPTTLENARCLCRPCHVKVTSEFASKRADSRKIKGRGFRR